MEKLKVYLILGKSLRTATVELLHSSTLNYLLYAHTLLHKVTGATFYLGIDFSYILTYDAASQQDGSTDEPQAHKQRGPARNGTALDIGHNTIDYGTKGNAHK